MPDAAISTEHLTRRFGATLAVDQLSLTIEPGEVFGFLGHNGAGKTTTVRLLNGVLTPSAGHIRVLGMDPTTHGPTIRRQSGVLTETPALDDRLSAHDSLRYAAELFGVPAAQVERRISDLLELFGLAQHANQLIASFSKGMRQRMALARTLIHDPELLFLDEPTAGLDPVATRDVHELITQLSRTRRRTVFLCTHNLVEAQRLCDRVAVLAQGRLLAQGTPSELVQQFGGRQRVHLIIDPTHEEKLTSALQNWVSVLAIERVAHAAGTFMVQGVVRNQIPALIEQLVTSGVAIFSIAPQEPTLEEVYLSLQDTRSQHTPDHVRGQLGATE